MNVNNVRVQVVFVIKLYSAVTTVVLTIVKALRFTDLHNIINIL